ncbi:unnamed protein product [Schistosoma margrebowiei]|uniref:C2H2-type domain-containing protein n=1 Tax=Schistosoma margrebowiei TaxID=48269 RepID=A0AA85AMB3_9TREM|nr:unnamed protein product [Schistosoma margrebowiei]
MLHRPTLMPASMKSSSKFKLSTNSKHSSHSIKIENPELIQLLNCGDDDDDDEIVIVEPTDPDEDRMKQEDATFDDVLNKEQENYAEEDYNGNDGDMNSNDSHMKGESHIPVSNVKVDEATGNVTPVTVTTDSVKPIGILPLNDVIHNLLTCTPHVAPTIQNVALQPILSGKMNGSGSVQMPNVVSNALPTLWLHSPVVNSTGMSVPNVNSVTDLTSNIVQNSGTALNPLVAAVLVNCATVNMISQLAGSMCTPMVNSSMIDVNVNGSNVNNNSNHISSGCSVSSGSSGVNTVTIPTASLLPNLLSAIPLSTYISGLGLNTTGGIITSPNSLCNVGVTSTAVSSAATLTNNNNNIGGMIVTPSNVENIMVSLSSARSQAEKNDVMYNTERSVVNNSSNEIIKNIENNNDDNNNNATTVKSESFQSYMIIPDSRTMFSTEPTRELRKYHCTYPGCDKSFARRCRLNQHISRHMITDPISCDAPNCNVKYFSEEDLKRHKLSQHSSADQDSSRQYACTFSECSRLFSNLSKLKEHLRTHTGERPYSVKRHEFRHGLACKFNERFSSSADIVSNCTNPTIFDTSGFLRTNFKTTSPLRSPISKEPTEKRDVLLNSSNISKNRILPAIAPKSTVSLPSPHRIKRQEIRIHFVCPFKECGIEFLQPSKLREHICRHTGERPFVCDQCKASFVRMYDLRRHSNIHIRGAQPRSLSRFLTTPQQTNETLKSIVTNSQISVSTASITTPYTATITTTINTTNTIPTVTTTVSATSLISDTINPTIFTVPVSISTLKVKEESEVIKMEEIIEQSTILQPCDTDDQSSTHTLLYTLLQSKHEKLQSP